MEAIDNHALTSLAQPDPRWIYSCVGALVIPSWAIVVAIAITLAANICQLC